MELLLQSSSTIKDSVYTVSDFKRNYLSGIPLPSSIDDSVLEFHLESSIVELENFLSLRFKRQIIAESKDFVGEEWRSWGFIPTTYPVVCPILLEGFFNTVKQISYPREWLSVRRTSDNKSWYRQLHIVPGQGSTHQNLYSGRMTQIGLFGVSKTPNYWEIRYITGWEKLPLDIENCLGILTSSKVLQIISDALMTGALQKTVDNMGKPVLFPTGSGLNGLGLGVSNKSISIDGLSQNYSTYVNGQTGVWGARLKQYMDLLDPAKQGSLMNRLKDQYGSIFFGVA